jgi:hypothetical protein
MSEGKDDNDSKGLESNARIQESGCPRMGVEDIVK